MMIEGILSYQDGGYILLDREHHRVVALRPGQVFEVKASGQWQVVMLKSGGYRGRYIETSDGQRSRLALCMLARLDTSPPAPDGERLVASVAPLHATRHTPHNMRRRGSHHPYS